MPKRKIDFNLTKLTDGEKMWYVRKYVYYYNQYEMANYTGCGHNMYCDLELGRKERTGSWNTVPELKALKTVPLGVRLALARRRAGLGLVKVAAKLGVSRLWYLALERAADQRVIAFWTDFGFKL